eukprot:2494820-Pyramimonas_sp.AAC.1
MAWHCALKRCITKRCNAKRGIAQLRRTQHRTACHGVTPGSLDATWIVFEWSAPVWSRGSMSSSWAFRKAPHKAGLMKNT